MQDYGFYNKRERTPDLADQSKNNLITDLPDREPRKEPKDLPSPRHRPGEPILYDPPMDEGMEHLPMVDPTYRPFTGMSLNDPTEFK